MKHIETILYTKSTVKDIFEEYQPGFELAFLKHAEHNINRFINTEGYITLRDIYAFLEIPWNPYYCDPVIVKRVDEDSSFRMNLIEHYDETGKRDGYYISMFYG